MPQKTEPERYKFSKTTIAKLPLPGDGKDRAYYLDSQTPGLSVCVTATGARTFYWYRKVNGRPVRVRLGKFPDELTVEQARKQADKHTGGKVEGIDPQAAKRRARQEATIGDLFAHWLDRAKVRKRTWEEDQRYYNNFVKPWANRKLSAIDRTDVQALHARIGRNNGHYTANRLLALVRAMFNQAPSIGWTGANPCRGVERFAETKRDRFLQPAELPEFFKSLAAEPSEVMRDFFIVALFTGQRRQSVQAMAWVDVDLDGRVWRVPEASSKNGKPIYVPLDDAVLLILRRRLESKGKHDWVFPSPLDASTHLREPKHAWERLCERAGLTDVRMHDLRRTMGSYQAMAGASMVIIGKALGHRSQAATEVYARVTLDPVRDAVGKAVESMQQYGGLLTAPVATEGVQ